MRCLPFVAVLLLTATPIATAQTTDEPRPDDVATLDGIIKAYYEVVSAPAGATRDWARDRSLHHPDAHVTIIGRNAAGEPVANVMTLADYHERSGATTAQGFFEYEIHRVTQRYGNTVHVWSTYEWKRTEDGPVGGRGINSIQLYWAEGRWWITAWMYDGEGGDIPADFLPEQ